MRLETEQMAEVYGHADHRQGSMPSTATQLTILEQVEILASVSNDKLSTALDKINAAHRDLEAVAMEQRHAILALAAVAASADHHEVKRGQTLRERAERVKR